MTEDDYQVILAKTYELTGQGKLEEFATYLADDVSWTEAAGFPYAGTYVGKEAVLNNVHKRLGTEWIGYTAEPLRYAFNGQQVMVYGRYSGTYKKSKKSFQVDFVHLYTFNADNKVSQFIQVVDSYPVVKAMEG